MKTGIALGLCVVLGAGFISVRAADNPAQAAARLALEQKLYELDHLQTPPPAPVASSATVVEKSRKSAATATGTVSAKAATLQTATAPTTPVAAPAAAAPTTVAPTAVAPARAILIAGLLVVSLLTVSSLIVSLLLLKLRQQNSRV